MFLLLTVGSHNSSTLFGANVIDLAHTQQALHAPSYSLKVLWLRKPLMIYCLDSFLEQRYKTRLTHRADLCPPG